MEIDVVRPQELTPVQLARWAGLQAPGLDSPFLSPHWARTVERTQAAGVQHTRVAVLRQDGRDVGFFAARAGAITAMPAGAPMCDYQGVVAEPGVVVDPKALVAALGVHRLDYSHMLEEQAAFAPYARGRSVSHVVDVSQGFEAYAEARKAAGVGVLKDAAKKRRKAEREAGEARFTAFSRASTDFDQLIAWKRAQLKSTDQTDIFEAGWTLRLLRELFESRDPDFGGVLFTLHLGDQLAAAHFHLHGRSVIHGWMIAHNPELERYSPGVGLFVDILQWMDQTPYQRLDLGPGDYRFKTELANTAQGVTHGFVGLPSAACLVRSAAYGVVRAAEALPLGPVSRLPAKALRRMDQWRGLR